jgi:hypothetical protein
MLIKAASSALRNSQWSEYAVRFALGGAGVDFLRHGDRVGVTIVMPWQEG